MSYDIDMDVSRRKFVKGAFAGVAAMGLPDWFLADARAAMRERESERAHNSGPNSTIQIGGIGLGGSKGGFQQGLNDTRKIGGKSGVKVIAVCDVDKTHLDEAAAVFGPDARKYHDYRDLIANKAIDAVVIGAPDHWHVPIAMAALKAGKDVYCEKPLTLTIDEGKKLTALAKQTRRVFQVGSQQRSDANFRLACELVRNNRLGRIKTVTAHLPTGPTGGPFKPQPVPSDFDFEMWLGPTPEADYFPERTHGNFRWWLAYSGGMLTDWGAHHNDIAQWGLGTDHTGPVSVQAYGKGPLIGIDCYTTFPEFDVYSTYANGITLITTSKGDNGVTFEGDKGWIFVSRSAIKASDDQLLSDPLPSNAARLYVSNDHHQNFIDCIRSRKETICPAEVGHRSATICHLANISLRLSGRKLEWDPEKEAFRDDKEATELLSRTPRKNWHG